MTFDVPPMAAWLRAGRHRSLSMKRVAIACSLASVGVGIVMLATGAVSIVSIRGASMEPAMTHGDLAIVSPASSYDVGDVVAFRSEQLGQIVVHRIIDREGDRFVLQGDGNGWIDLDRPTDAQILGVVRAGIPFAGTLLGWARHPVSLALLGLALGLTLAGRTDQESPDG